MFGSIGAVGGGFQPQLSHGGAQSLTDSQKSLISETLSKYDADSLSASDAKNITETFKEAGIRPGGELSAAVSEAGFDAKEIGALAFGGKPSGPPPIQSQGSTPETDILSLLEDALDQAGVDEDDQDAFLSFLEESGISKPGSIFDYSV